MICTLKNRRIIALLTVIMLSLSATGFTAILHSCLMAEMDCCDEPMAMMMRDFHDPASDAPALKVKSDCCSVTVAGGLNDSPIVAGNQKSDSHQTDVLMILPLAVISGNSQLSSHTILAFSSSGIVPLPSVEKYILNAAFLI
jgi:hypothetical protein